MTEPARQPDPIQRAYALALAPYIAALRELTRFRLSQAIGAPPRVAWLGAEARAIKRLADTVVSVRGYADMLGRRTALKVADALAGGKVPPTPPANAGVLAGATGPKGLPRVEFTEAVADMVAREPRLAHGAAEVAKVYNERHGFALAKSTDLEVTKRAQRLIAKTLSEGTPIKDAEEALAKMGDWTRAYAETAIRTNAATAYSAGRFRQMAYPAVSRVIAALRYTTAGDVDVRPNHRAFNGLTAAPSDPIWHQAAPPHGFQCRCGLDFVSWAEARAQRIVLPSGEIRLARMPRNAHSDPGFVHEGRPDIALYGFGG